MTIKDFIDYNNISFSDLAEASDIPESTLRDILDVTFAAVLLRLLANWRQHFMHLLAVCSYSSQLFRTCLARH